MTVISSRVEGILEQSRKIEFLKTMRLWIAAIFYGIAWVIGRTLKGIWRLLAFVWVACVVGFKSGIGKEGG